MKTDGRPAIKMLEKSSSNTHIVYVDIKEKYGNTLYYPACENGLRFADMTGNKTLRMSDLTNIKALGFSIQAIAPEVETFNDIKPYLDFLNNKTVPTLMV